MFTLSPPEETGAIGVFYLKRFWSRSMARMPLSPDDWERQKLLVDGLGIGQEQIARYLATSRTFEELEQWVLELNGGALDAARMRRLNAALLGQPYDEETNRWLTAIDQSPAVLDAEQIDHWTEHGYVVLHHAISSEAAAAAAAVVYDYVGAQKDDPQTWYSRRNMQGIMVQIFQHPALQPARESAVIHKAFAQLWGSSDLFPTTDRCGFNPPEHDRYRFPGPHLHWDADLTRPLKPDFQGILYLEDVEPEQGAFTCVPGFHREIGEWLTRIPPNTRFENHIPRERAIPIAGRAGDLVIWHHALPHGSSPNRARKPRVVQYIKMFPPPVKSPGDHH
jgi:ectoine hydroxylase-related dioxygenase (phytanoyl-CoA dioxygenase family)